MLDSSPVSIPQIRNSLKRSASTASLPTPPRTYRKRGRGRSRGSCDSDSDDRVLLDSDEEELAGSLKKRRKTRPQKGDDEEAFWLGDSKSNAADGTGETGSSQNASSVTMKTRSTADSSPPVAPLLYRRLQNSGDVLLASPPPSHRKSTMPVSPPSIKMASATSSVDPSPNTFSPPATPKTKPLLRDSPENPFLNSSPLSSAPDRASLTRLPFKEKKTTMYVFRGMRRTFLNPYYDHDEDRPLSPDPNSQLPVDHPDFSPSSHCPPKLLFPEQRRRSTRRRNNTTRRLNAEIDGYESKDVETLESQSTSEEERSEDDEVEENWDEIKPLKLSFAEGDAKTAGPSRAIEADEHILSRGEGGDEVQQSKIQEAEGDRVELSVV